MNRHAIFFDPCEESQFVNENWPAADFHQRDLLSGDDIHHVAHCGPTGEEPRSSSVEQFKENLHRNPHNPATGKDINNYYYYYEYQVSTTQMSGGKKDIAEELSGDNDTKEIPIHPIDIFFKSISETVKQFPQHLVTEAKMKVCNLIGELELQAYLHKNSIVSCHNPYKK